jgi:hypothetical protein
MADAMLIHIGFLHACLALVSKIDSPDIRQSKIIMLRHGKTSGRKATPG